MINKFFLLFFGVFLLGFISSMYAGTNYSFTIETTDKLFWDALGNSSNMEGFQVFQEINGSQSIITFYADLQMKPDNFTILLYSNTSSEIEIIKEVPVYSGGGGHTRILTKEIVKEVPNYVTEYLDNETIKLVNNETIKEVPLENKGYYVWIGLVFGVCSSFILIFIAIKIFINRIKKSKEKVGVEE